MKSEQMEEAAPVMIQTLEWLIHVNANSKQYEERKCCVDNAQTRRTKKQQAAKEQEASQQETALTTNLTAVPCCIFTEKQHVLWGKNIDFIYWFGSLISH